MILSDRDIRARMMTNCPHYGCSCAHLDCIDEHCQTMRIWVQPEPEDRAFQPASIDLKLASAIKVEWGDGLTRRPLGWSDVDLFEYGNIGYPVMPNTVILASTEEKIFIPHDLAARVEGKSSLGRLFVSVHETAGFIDPGFEGTVTLEIRNNSPVVQHLWAGMYICQINFTQMTSPALRPYGSEGLGSHYQGQGGPTPSAG